MSTLADLQRSNLERMKEREVPVPEQADDHSPALLPASQEIDIKTSRHQDNLTDSNLSHLTPSNTDVQQDIQPSSITAINLAGRSAVQKVRKGPKADGKTLSDRPPAARAGETGPAEYTEYIDPVDQALLQKLNRPYPDLAKEKSTLVSSRLPDDVVERLGLAADLVKKHKKNKQDVIARGLILAFEELIRAGGDVEWYER